MSVNAATLPASATLIHAPSLAAADLKRVDALILECVSAEIPLIRDVARHIIASGGKRLRPLLTLLCAAACGYEGERHIGLAAAVEFMHTATLLHDDVVDDSHLRRGLATANDVFGNKTSVLVGDFLLSKAFQLMVADGAPLSLKILSDAAAVIARGEVKQLACEGNPALDEADYLDVIACKTAALFAAACELGPVVAGDTKLRAPMRIFGQNLGIAFQLVDDALDYSANQQQLGKTLGDDFREGKVTLPVLLAWQSGGAQERAFWQRTLTDRDQQPEDFAHALSLVQAHGTLSATLHRARQFCAEALTALAPLPESAQKNALHEIVEFCAGRGY